MCGICGQVSLDGEWRPNPAVVEQMMNAMLHRGPDEGGLYTDSLAALGHRRLSIIDLSGGRQPVSNEDGTIWVVFNGEIYNFKELRRSLIELGHVFATNTDTEVIVHAYEQYGETCLSKLAGMFGFALWDNRRRLLLLARDRVGIKPLYYRVGRDSISFASEIKALLADPDFSAELDAPNLPVFLTYLYTPGPGTLFRGVRKLEPGHYLVVHGGKISIRQYWDLRFEPERPAGGTVRAAGELDHLLRQVIRDHMVSDVPVGVLLSGGIDSSCILSYLAEEPGPKPRTFTIGYSGGNFPDERAFARRAARDFGSEHEEIAIDASEFGASLEKYVWHMEEPVCEPPAIALYHVTRLASGRVKVLLSGEGGDETFAGYHNYRNLLWLERIKGLGAPSRFVARTALRWLSRAAAFRRAADYAELIDRPFPDYYYSRTSGPLSYFNRMGLSLFDEDFRAQAASDFPNRCMRSLADRSGAKDLLHQMLYIDSKTWLPDDLLLKADKMTMAHSVELRVPLLDHRVLEFAARLPAGYKVRGLATKYILKKACRGRIPQEIISRRKMGFPAPYAAWLQRELREMCWDILTDSRAVSRGYFNRNAIERLLLRTSDHGEHASEVFALLVFELWNRAFLDRAAEQRDKRRPAFAAAQLRFTP